MNNLPNKNKTHETAELYGSVSVGKQNTWLEINNLSLAQCSSVLNCFHISKSFSTAGIDIVSSGATPNRELISIGINLNNFSISVLVFIYKLIGKRFPVRIITWENVGVCK